MSMDGKYRVGSEAFAVRSLEQWSGQSHLQMLLWKGDMNAGRKNMTSK